MTSLKVSARAVGRVRLAVLGLTGTHLAAHALDVNWLVAATKPLLVPGLAFAFAASTPSGPTARTVLAALGASTAGDVALMLDGTSAWLAGAGAFLVAQGCYVRAFADLGALESLRRNPLPALAYGGAWMAANASLGPQLGELRGPVLVYSAALCAMGATSATLGRRIAAGGAGFVLSDLLIGIRVTGAKARALDVAVMATYVAAQYLLSTGASAALSRGAGAADAAAGPAATSSAHPAGP